MHICSFLPSNRVSYMDKNRKEEIWKTSQDTFGTREQDIILIGDITRQLMDFTEEFGRTIMEKFQKITIFIIRMGTLPTIALKILSAFINISIIQCISVLRDKLRRCTRSLRVSRGESGYGPKKAEETRDWQGKKNGLRDCLLSESA